MLQKKSLGQNFLRSKKAIAQIVEAGEIVAGETILEAGPGEGILTAALLEAGAKVIAIEKDRRLIVPLQIKFTRYIQSGMLTLIENDILEFSIFNFQFSKYKVIANIPYYITGAFIRRFLEAEHQPSHMVLLLQKEVAERIVARDGKESILSISVKAYGEPRYIQTVKAGSFSPAPKVDSAILAIENISKKNFSDTDEKRFFEIVKAGFAHKRKIISGNLKPVLGNQTEEKMYLCGIETKARAEKLTLEGWLCLSKL